ncbi:cupin domain-containing protein [Prochlorococcus marinus]|uniref:cupin domain-containing protein n=1 Tax=Prochlorococcus marinus TaxID=1219 RepID=UPI0022B36FBF|nr:cupin domain-containing protein [Prochlorococcus marinus]
MTDSVKSGIKSLYLHSFMRRFLFLALTAGISIPLVGCNPNQKYSLEPVIVETLISANESWNGDSFKYPRGQAEMKLEKITAQPGFKTPLHLHPQPGIVYVQKGSLYCETSDGESLTVKSGESFASSQDTPHFCQNNGNGELVVFSASAGARGKETTVPTE